MPPDSKPWSAQSQELERDHHPRPAERLKNGSAAASDAEDSKFQAMVDEARREAEAGVRFVGYGLLIFTVLLVVALVWFARQPA